MAAIFYNNVNDEHDDDYYNKYVVVVGLVAPIVVGDIIGS